MGARESPAGRQQAPADAQPHRLAGRPNHLEALAFANAYAPGEVEHISGALGQHAVERVRAHQKSLAASELRWRRARWHAGVLVAVVVVVLVYWVWTAVRMDYHAHVASGRYNRR